MSAPRLADTPIVNGNITPGAHVSTDYEFACGCSTNSPEDRKLYVKIFVFSAAAIGFLTLGVYGLVARLG